MGPCQDLQWTGGRATLRFCVRLPEVVARQGETSCGQAAAATMGETVLAPMTGLMFSLSLSRSLRRKKEIDALLMTSPFAHQPCQTFKFDCISNEVASCYLSGKRHFMFSIIIPVLVFA